MKEGALTEGLIMKATLDTNVIIHLYDAGLEEVLHSSFDKIYVYEYIIETELMNHGSVETKNAVRQDIADGKIVVIKKKDLLEIGMGSVFEDHVRENRTIYEPGDLGEIYAIALAKTLGLMILVTDDIKEYGPHYSLMHDVYAEVIPIAFYELFFFNFLEGKITASEFISYFEKVNSLLNISMSLEKCVYKFDTRFWYDPISDREKHWFSDWCSEIGVNYEKKYDELWDAMEEQQSKSDI
jgi:predicted nucleic acid-binding protein